MNEASTRNKNVAFAMQITDDAAHIRPICKHCGGMYSSVSYAHHARKKCITNKKKV